MLSKYFDLENINIIPKNEFNLYPKASNRDFWDNISFELKQQLISKGEKYLDFKYPLLLASDFMKFEREGQRPPYEEPYAVRRDALNALVLAECAEHKGRFTDDIINGIYLICEETTWVVPAHNYKDIRFGTHDGNNTLELWSNDNIVIELRSTKTAHDLALVYYLLKDELDMISPLICRRLEIIIEERLISLYEKYDDYFWKTETNNWNPQCNVHCLVAAMIMIDDDERRRNFVKKLLKSVNVFYSSFINDGGCEEGVLYWDHSCGNLFRTLDVVKYISYGKIDMMSEQKLCNMGAFPVDMYIGDGRFVNLADCTSYCMPCYELLYSWGIASNNESLVALSKIAKQTNLDCSKIEDVMVYDKIDKAEARIINKKECFYPDLEVAILRDGNEYLFAAKGGHNNESHNHCDVGSFTIYRNNKPVVIDPGTEQYISKSFTPERYAIWYNNSLHHNVPSINGKMQKNGPRYDGVVMPQEKLVAPMYCASDAKYETDSFSLDISGAYGDENIKKWKREFYFDRNNKSLVVTEDYELSEESSIELVFMLAEKPEIQNDRVLLAEGVVLNKGELEANCSQITDMGAKMVKQWGGMYRLSLTAKGKAGKINYSFNW